MRIRLCGTNHRRAPVDVRERLALPYEELAPALHRLHALDGVREVVLVSTCNRVEVIWVEDGGDEGQVEAELCAWSGLPLARLEQHLDQAVDDGAVRHLFRVCSSLDSMVLGESQILGQVKDAYRLASDSETVGPILHRLFHKAFAVAKRVRSETEVGSSTLSVARAAVDMAGAVFEDLRSKTILLLGAGEMAELALRGFRDKGCRDLWVANRTLERAAEVAGPLEAAVMPWNRRVEFLASADIVVASTGARSAVLTRADVKSVRRKRKGRPLLLIDISVPRNLDAAINELDSTYLFDIDDLGRVVQSGKEARRREADKAEALVGEEVAAFSRILSRVHVSPLLRALNQRVGTDASQEVARTMARLAPRLKELGPDGLGEVEQALQRMATALGKRFLHHPMARIKGLGEQGEIDRLDEAASLLGVKATLLSVREIEEPAAERPREVGDTGER
jgi:glutamyl-tRNA reductase